MKVPKMDTDNALKYWSCTVLQC